jgi:hypothetical protein
MDTKNELYFVKFVQFVAQAFTAACPEEVRFTPHALRHSQFTIRTAQPPGKL